MLCNKLWKSCLCVVVDVKKFAQKIAVVLLVLLVASQLVLCVYLCNKNPSQGTGSVNFTIVVDAGHGGVDGGVQVDGVKESDLNLAYSKSLGNLLETCGFNVVYTRHGKDGLYGLPTQGFKRRDMQKRQQIILQSNANLVVSIHMNKFSQSIRSGPQVFYQSGSDSQFAQSVQQSLNSFTGNAHSALGGDFFVCRVSPCPAIIVECGFLSNPTDWQNLQTDVYRQQICQSIFNGMMLYLYST